MKNVKTWALSLLIAMAAPFCANAQIHQSKSYSKHTTITKIKKEDTCKWKKCQWYIDAGLRIPTNAAIDEDPIKVNYKTGFELALGFQRRIGCKGWYWGMNIAFVTSGVSAKNPGLLDPVWGDESKSSSSHYGFQTIPVTFGWRKWLTNDWMLDLNLGLGAEAYPSNDGVYKYGYIRDMDFPTGGLCVPIGVGARYKKLRINLKYQITACFEKPWGEIQFDRNSHSYNYDYIDDLGSDKRNCLRLTVGYAF